MIAICLSALFALAGVVAIASIWSDIARYGRSALAIRGELQRCPRVRQVNWKVEELVVRPTATVIRPDFQKAGMAGSRQHCPAPRVAA